MNERTNERVNVMKALIITDYLVELYGPTLSARSSATSVQLNEVFVFLLLAPPPGRNVPSRWLAPRTGMTCVYIRFVRKTHLYGPTATAATALMLGSLPKTLSHTF